ncbi:MAG: hypothetical protein QNJ32_10690 [Xenococcaceae cyanobacterium MO_167.B27]|nr:hypothetical protein [Xenococcaceae cyanobacterium MO_167.B27]
MNLSLHKLFWIFSLYLLVTFRGDRISLTTDTSQSEQASQRIVNFCQLIVATMSICA